MAPCSCCSRMRVDNCCWSATSFPWACLMKGCSRRWVTDGRASKSFIRHLTNTKASQSYLISLLVIGKENWWKTDKTSLPLYHLPILKSANDKLRSHLNIVETWFVRISSDRLSHQWRASLMSGSLICRSMSEYHMVTITMAPSPNKPCHGLAVRPICDVQCLPIGDFTLWYWLAAALQHQFAADLDAHNILSPDTRQCKTTHGKTHFSFISDSSDILRDKKISN